MTVQVAKKWSVGKLALAIGIGVIVVVVGLIIVELPRGAAVRREERLMAEAEAWGASLVPIIAKLDGVAEVQVAVPCRYYSHQPPSWHVLVVAVALDNAAEQRIKDTVAAAHPPKEPVGWSISNCLGDRDLFDKMRQNTK